MSEDTIYNQNLKIARELGKDRVRAEKLINVLFNDFAKNYRESIEGINHSQKYGLEREEVNTAFNNILAKKNNGEDYVDDVFDILFARENQVHWDTRVKNLRPFLAKKYNPKEIDDIIKFFILLLETLIKQDKDYNQKKVLKQFKAKTDYIGVNRISSILYYLDDSYYVINSKTVGSVNFLLLLFPDDFKITKDINNYIDENRKLHAYINRLTYYIDGLSNDDETEMFETFDMFCHWLCDKNLGSYARLDAQNLLPIDKI